MNWALKNYGKVKNEEESIILYFTHIVIAEITR